MFYSGQKVICVDASAGKLPHTWGKPSNLVRDQVYTVLTVRRHPRGLVLDIRETQPPIGAGYFASRFRPAVQPKTDISIFQRMLDRTPENV